MKIAGLLPHVEVYGGVRRYLELGNAFVDKGHSFTLFHPSGQPPEWLEFRGQVRPFTALDHESFDIGMCSEYSILAELDRLKARRKFFYFLLEGHKREKEVTRRPFLFLGNSEGLCRRLERKHGLTVFKAAGGINPRIFHPLKEKSCEGRNEFRVLCYGRIYKKRKGISRAVKAVDGLFGRYPGLRLVLFDTLVGRDQRDPRPLVKTRVPHEFHLNLPQSRMAWLYSRADLFLSAERRAGWANTAAEAMACGVPVVCTPSGTRDFALHGQTALVVSRPWPLQLRRAVRRLLEDPALRRRLAEEGCRKIQEFTWEALAERLESHFEDALAR